MLAGTGVTNETIIYLAVLTVCTIASGFFSGSETALISISRERVHLLAQKDQRGRRLERLISQPERMLSTLLVANNAVNVLSASIATILFVSLIGDTWGPWVATGVMTATLLVFGEITPKTIGSRYPEAVSLRVAPVIWNLSIVLAPIARFFSATTRVLLRLLRINVDGGAEHVTEDDIRALAALSLRGGQIDRIEREIIDAVFSLADTAVRDVMTPRLDIVTLPMPLRAEDLRRAVAETGHSRFPVTARDLDDLQGIAHVKDLLGLPESDDDSNLTRIIRTPNYVPETMSVLDTLEEMRASRYGMAVVVDEHGGVEGIVTIKDLVAELVGELQDEYDPGTPSLTTIAKGIWIADGRLDIDDLCEATEHEVTEGPYSTVGGFILTTFGKIPAPGDQIVKDGYRYTVLSMERQRVDRIRVERLG